MYALGCNFILREHITPYSQFPLTSLS